ncbi:MAG: Tex-like N-terminal domain-containing protein, partial [Gemmatimonadota bacterium]
MAHSPSDLSRLVARELALPLAHVSGALELFAGGATLPFIARYRKEATGGLDEVQLRNVRDRAAYLGELEERRSAVLDSIQEQGALDPELRTRILAAATKQELEDLYLPYRPKRRTRGSMAVERGLQELAELIWEGRAGDAEVRRRAADFRNPAADVPDQNAALQGARDILAERLAEDPRLRRVARDVFTRRGVVFSRVVRGKSEDPVAARFRDYFQFTEPVRSVRSHRVLAIRRGEKEGVLRWGVGGPEGELESVLIRAATEGRAARDELRAVALDSADRVLGPSIASEVASDLKDRADREAIEIFGTNLEQLLLQPPAGARGVLGLDPGFRTGVKAALVSATGAVQTTATLYLHRADAFRAELLALLRTHRPDFVAIGNGTASRETEA